MLRDTLTFVNKSRFNEYCVQIRNAPNTACPTLFSAASAY